MSQASDPSVTAARSSISDAAAAPVTPMTSPVIVDMGRKKRKAYRRLRKGRDRAMKEVAEVVEEVRHQLGDQAESTTIIPVVVLYRRKRRARARWF